MALKGKTALITGVSSGIGLALIREMLDLGMKVYGLGRNHPGFDHPNFRFHRCDIREVELVGEVMSKIKEEVDQIDFLINNAGLGRFKPVEQMDIDTWKTMMDTNLSGMFYITREVVPIMKAHKAGHIINISSIAGRVGAPWGSGYNASKFGVSGFSESLFHELRKEGIKVTVVYPGAVKTPFFDEIPSVTQHDYMLDPKDLAATILHLMDSPPNYLVREIEVRPLISKPPK